jgi:two-component system phosphate regulon sensor histidine kinase PhoR
LVTVYVLSLAATMALLVGWVVYLVHSASRLEALGSRVGVPAGGVNWWLLGGGSALFFFVIVALTYQLALALAARRYALKQDEFVSNITHEMKSPLAAIKLHAQTLQQEDTSVDRRRSLAHIVQQADRMGSLVDNVLESSRLLARKRRLDLAPVDVAAFFAGYFGGARPAVENRGVRLRAEVSSRAYVLATDEALRQVMDNLIDNAVRFSRPGGEVRCRVSEAGAMVRIEVEDDGAGIPKKELRDIFERFYQAGRASNSHRRGTGLGLAIVSGLAREMRGSARAYSQEGRPGSRFVVDLPAAGETA